MKTKKGSIPYINFFQYPPMRNASFENQTLADRRLGLHQAQADSAFFTVFISIPYCRSKCNSCPYFKGFLPAKVDQHNFLEGYVDCLETQIQKYAATARFSTATCQAVYIGGGTASLLAADQVARLIRRLKGSFATKPDMEITLEGNPHDFSADYLALVRHHGVNRVSLGYQSSNESLLRKAVNSPHRATEGRAAVINAINSGFHTVNLDLLYRLPGQTFDDWRRDLETALMFGPQGITIYEYIIHTGSNTEKLINRHFIVDPVDEQTSHSWYTWARHLLNENGYVEHRKGSFSKPGHTQIYGALTYGEGSELIGIGAGAYSYINGFQFKGPENGGQFKEQIQNDMFPLVELISPPPTNRNLRERFVIFGFLSSVLNRQEYQHQFGHDVIKDFPNEFSSLGKAGLLEIKDDQISLTDQGIAHRNFVLYEFYDKSFLSEDFRNRAYLR